MDFSGAYVPQIERRHGRLCGIEDADSIVSSSAQDPPISNTVMSVVWAAGKLSAAVYDLETSIVSLLSEMVENVPDYLVLKLLYAQFLPKFLLVSSRQDEQMLNALKELCSSNVLEGNPSSQASSSTSTGAPSRSYLTQLIIMAGREFAPDPCKKRVKEINLPYEKKPADEQEHLIFLTSIFPMGNQPVIRVLGSLLKFMDKKAVNFPQLDISNGKTPVLDIKMLSMDEVVMVDNTAWSSLQIFHLDFHPSNLKFGSKEGLSVFRILNRCVSPSGSKFLRSMLNRPVRNPEVLKRRHDIIEFCSNFTHSEFVSKAQGSLKQIKNIQRLLYKVSVVHATIKEWSDLLNSLYQCIVLGHLCASFDDDLELELIKEIAQMTQTEDFRSVVYEIQRIIDFEESDGTGRISMKAGLFDQLDEKKEQYSKLPEVMSIIAAEEMHRLPLFVIQCSVVYFPEVGYLLALVFCRELSDQDISLLVNVDFQFSSHEISYYKSPRMREMDIVVGDCQLAIMDMEIAMLIELTNFIMAHQKMLITVEQLVAELDCLIGLGKVAMDYGFVRPQIVNGGERLYIENGRNPICEVVIERFVPNSTIFEEDEKIVILTGPNASGKSIYLKQVGIITLMALAGSFVPATKAIIPTFDAIFTRIHSPESIGSGLSTFMIDLNQMSLALRNATSSSLLLIDEFGKGTLETDGLALLIASMNDFVSRSSASPHIFLSTHFLTLVHHLANSPLLRFQTMEYAQEQNGSIIYLFKLKDGISESSLAHAVAQTFGIDGDIIRRSLEVMDLLKSNRGGEAPLPLPAPLNFSMEDDPDADAIIAMAENFLRANINELSPTEILHLIDIDNFQETIVSSSPDSLPNPPSPSPPPNGQGPSSARSPTSASGRDNDDSSVYSHISHRSSNADVSSSELSELNIPMAAVVPLVVGTSSSHVPESRDDILTAESESDVESDL